MLNPCVQAAGLKLAAHSELEWEVSAEDADAEAEEAEDRAEEDVGSLPREVGSKRCTDLARDRAAERRGGEGRMIANASH